MKKAALVEIGGSHDATLYSQLLFLKDGGYEAHVICSENLKTRIVAYDIADHILSIDFEKEGHKQGLKQIPNYIKQHNIDTLILNTAQGKQIRDLMLMRLPSPMSIAGTIHDAKKIARSFSQYLISRRLRKYFVLNDYMLPFVPSKRGIKVESYYPVYFPEYPRAQIMSKNKDEIWVTIPGQLEYKRRDYLSLAKALSKLGTVLPLKFILLGNSMHSHGNGPDFKQQINGLGVEQYFKIWDNFVDDSTFHTYINESDFVMPLLHPGFIDHSEFEGYNQYQVSGAFVLAISYKKPMLMFEGFDRYDDFKNNSYFYNLNTLPELLNQLPALNAHPKKVFEDSKWDFEIQCKKYLDFIEAPERVRGLKPA